ncbi:uncharacterized protein LOC105257598 isoform X3 [Camponotus floridanus]|uniref:uncharacterized protein LOC105257598 isoform X3 n=1 Tax=Camponotus floridanus TaxID=104421 RepID=UPI000DC68D68|nr:uncharacterized protein LOC105257598 isoform X3 [Camponotus floridanus]
MIEGTNSGRLEEESKGGEPMQRNGVTRNESGTNHKRSVVFIVFVDFPLFSTAFSGMDFSGTVLTSKKCGYCGWILTNNMDILQPMHHVFLIMIYEAINTIIIDENNIVTIGYKPGIEVNCSNSQDTDEMLIACVSQKPALYHHRLPVSERTNLKKNALWQEVCNMMGDIMDVTAAKKRWKYLKDCYAKDRKKSNEYIPSGSAAPKARKNTFRFYEAMSFLNDCMETRQTVSTLPRNSSVSNNPSVSISQALTLRASSIASTFNMSENGNTASSSENAEECATLSSNSYSSKKKKSKRDSNSLDEVFLTTLMAEPAAQNDPISNYALSLADGLRRLPYNERAKLQIEFLSRVMEVQNRLDSEMCPP